MNRNKNLTIAVALILFSIFLGVVQLGQEKQVQLNSHTLYSKKPAGLAAFFELIRSYGGKPSSNMAPFLRDLPINSQIAIFSPSAPLTTTEARKVATSVQEGGILLLSASNPSDLRNLSELTFLLNLHLSLFEIPSFKNQTVWNVSGFDSPIFPKANKYAFYSRYSVSDLSAGQEPSSAQDFYRFSRFGKGEVHFFVGFLPFSNALMRELDNKEVAIHFAKSVPQLIFDEYHHFFSDRTFWSLVAKPSFGIPVVSFFFLLILFFFFARTPLHDKHLVPTSVHSPLGFHDFSVRFIEAALKDSSASIATLKAHYQYLSHLYPTDRKLIEKQQDQHLSALGQNITSSKAFLKEAQTIIHFHKQLLIQKGRIHQ